MHNIFNSLSDKKIAEILINYSKSLTNDEFNKTRFYIQKLINYIMEERNVSSLDIYRALFIFNFNFERMINNDPMTMFNKYLLKRYFLAGGNEEIIDNLNCNDNEKEHLFDIEKEGRFGYVLSLFMPIDMRQQVSLSVEVPKIYKSDCFLEIEEVNELSIIKNFGPYLKK